MSIINNYLIRIYSSGEHEWKRNIPTNLLKDYSGDFFVATTWMGVIPDGNFLLAILIHIRVTYKIILVFMILNKYY